uniref:Putative ovule protein n=1 Tax=Solanum chacoense TaxID=4108 RepID=A0A0V0HBF9_SOLCH
MMVKNVLFFMKKIKHMGHVVLILITVKYSNLMICHSKLKTQTIRSDNSLVTQTTKNKQNKTNNTSTTLFFLTKII